MFESKGPIAGLPLKPLVLAVACAAPLLVHAQQATQEKKSLPAVTVTDTAESTNVLRSSSGAARIAGPIQDIPQSVSVVPQEVMQQQQVTTLEQALRNVPGITVAIGEANGGANGDQFRIRGAATKNDAYLDGLRDFGVYVRDTFNTERVEVLKGPSSENFGMGSNGGAINSETKLAKLKNEAAVEGMYGNGIMNRQAVDINRVLGETTALRLNAMRQSQDVVDRNNVKSDRWGVALSFGTGIGTATSWYLNYLHQSNDRTPDYGQPLIGRTATSVRLPVATYGINRSTYYGKDTDRDHSDADIITSLFKHRLSESTTLSNETRLGYYERMFTTTTATCDQTCANSYFSTGNGTITLGSGGGPRYSQRTVGLQNITTLASAFEAAGMKHDAKVGLDITYESDYRQSYAYMRPDMSGTTSKVTGTLLNPNNSSSNYIVAIDPNGNGDIKDSSMTDIALFASDRVHFTNQWSVLGSLRWDYYKQNAKLKTRRTGVTLGDVSTDSNFLSPKLSLIWEPTPTQTYYLSYGWASTTPWAGNISADATPLGVSATPTAAANALRGLDPEKTKTLELGGKVGLLDNKLGLTGAIFHTEKNNTYYDNGTGTLASTGNKERYNGVELGLTGQLTRQWSAYVGYAYLDSKIVDSTTKTNIGNPVQGAAKNSASAWTSYEFAQSGPGRLSLGGGVTYRDEMTIRDDKMAKVPYSLSYDAMIAYDYKNVRVALNGYNLANRLNYDNYFAGENADTARAIPSPGRTFVLSVRVAM